MVVVTVPAGLLATGAASAAMAKLPLVLLATVACPLLLTAETDHV